MAKDLEQENKNVQNYDTNRAIQRLYDKENLLDILIELEAVLDSMDIYAFDNWFKGEVVSGPWLERYWIKVILKYPRKEMPDPDGGLRLTYHGAKIKYEKAHEEVPVEVKSQSDLVPGQGNKPKTKTKPIWLVHIRMPRRFIEDMDTGVIDIDDEEEEQIDLSKAQQAEEEGLDAENAPENAGSEFNDGEQYER